MSSTVDISKYEGERNADGVPHGKGTCKWPDGNGERTYDGEWVAGHFMHGTGTSVSGRGTVYNGEFKDGFQCGRGNAAMSDGSSYQGEFGNNTREGRGLFKWASGASYDGEWKKGSQSGRGLFTAAQDRSRYDGEWFNNMKHGRGFHEHKANNWSYDGEYRQDKKHGRGLHKGGNVVYDGEWNDDLKHGRGNFTGKDHTYNGEYHKDKRHGRGLYTWKTSGSTYEGEWAMGVQNGRGLFTSTADGGWTYDGEWKNNNKHGRGFFKTLHYSFDGQYVDDKRNGRGLYKSATTRYDGEWKDEQKNGRGVQEDLRNGSVYEGEFKAHRKHGNARVKDKDGVVTFEGRYHEDTPMPTEGTNLTVPPAQRQPTPSEQQGGEPTTQPLPSSASGQNAEGRVHLLQVGVVGQRSDGPLGGGSVTVGDMSMTASVGGSNSLMTDSITTDRGSKSKNRFHIDRTKVLGKGGFGFVYEGFDTHKGRPIAVKESNKLDEATVAEQQELLDEFELLTTLRHENIVQVFGMNYDPGQCICQIFMQKLSAGSVESIIKTSRGYPFRLHEKVIRIYLDAALNGLAYMHEKGVRHGDIKAGNILVTEDGVAKLSDFGTSRVVVADATKKDNKGVGCTVPFLSPEAAHGHYGTASDIWALGCTVLEMATARAPWHHLPDAIKGRSDSLWWHIGSLNPTSPELHPRIPEHLSPGLASILRLMFSFKPEDRSSARSIAALPYFTDREFAKAKKAGEVESHETWVAEGEAVQAELEAQRQLALQEGGGTSGRVSSQGASKGSSNHQGDQFEMPAGHTAGSGGMYGNTNSVKTGVLDWEDSDAVDEEGAYDDRTRDMEVQLNFDTTQSQQ